MLPMQGRPAYGVVAPTNYYMRYRDLSIQTQRESPKNARTEGFSLLVRAGYLTRENIPTELGEYTINHFRSLADTPSFLSEPSLQIIRNEHEIFFPIVSGNVEVAHCPSCGYTNRVELARVSKPTGAEHAQRPLEKVLTPNCNTIEALANFLGIPKEKTAKALMYTRVSDNTFVFVVIRGDTQLSEAKLKQHVGETRAATMKEIETSGAAAGYASPIGLKGALIVVDDLIPWSQNLVAGANETGYHFRNTNYGRDYTADVVGDLTQARPGDPCADCGNPLKILSTIGLGARDGYEHQNIFLALAETYHDSKGLTFPHPVAPFVVYLMHIPGKDAQRADTRAKAEKIYNTLKNENIPVLFDDRDERAGVKFNDADLIGCPIRITVGEKGLKDGMVELKPRNIQENQLVPIEKIATEIKTLLK